MKPACRLPSLKELDDLPTAAYGLMGMKREDYWASNTKSGGSKAAMMNLRNGGRGYTDLSVECNVRAVHCCWMELTNTPI